MRYYFKNIKDILSVKPDFCNIFLNFKMIFVNFSNFYLV